MNLPREELLKGCSNPKGLNQLITQAERVLKSWQPSWSGFVEAQLKEEAFRRLTVLSDLEWDANGGYPEAERQRILCKRISGPERSLNEQAPISGILIEGNFLFDNPTPKDIREALQTIGLPSNGLGDIWIQGDRGAQALCTPEAAIVLNGAKGQVRDVKIQCEEIEVERLSLPAKRSPKTFYSIEASRRLDAIASAGFGISRAKTNDSIQKGKLRLNWQSIKHVHQEISPGDRLQLENKGSIQIISLNLTKRERWRVEIKRN